MPDNTVLIEDAEILFQNFTGRAGMYNAEGERSFAIALSEEMADKLKKDGWNVKTLRPRMLDDGTESAPRPYLSVSVEYDKGKPPVVVMITSRARTVLDKETVEHLDQVDIAQADVILNPYDWTMPSGASGRKAYLKDLYLTVNENPLELKYGPPATVSGPMMEMTGPYVPTDER